MDFGPLLYMAVGAIGSLVMWLVLGPIMTGYGVKKLARNAAEGDEDALQFFNDLGDVLMKWAAEPQRTGEKIKVPTDKKDADGNAIMKEIDEMLSPVELMARVIGNYAVMHMKGYMGGKKTQMQNQMADAIAQSGGDTRALIPIALQAASRGDYGPAIGLIMQELMSRKVDTSSARGGNL